VIFHELNRSYDFAVAGCLKKANVFRVCGIWLAYGEPPNLIMKAALRSLVHHSVAARER
jgi:hypothetical protein